LSKLKTITSTEDLVLTIALNQNTIPVYGIEKPATSLFKSWSKNPEYEKLLELLPIYERGLELRLFNAQALDENYLEAFQIKDVDADNILVTVYPGYFGLPQSLDLQRDLVSKLLKLLYGYSNYDVMARDVLFEQYLKRL
jgi:hypothetical protein